MWPDPCSTTHVLHVLHPSSTGTLATNWRSFSTRRLGDICAGEGRASIPGDMYKGASAWQWAETWLYGWKDFTSTKKHVFLMSLRITVQHLMWLQSWRFSLSTEHQLFMDFQSLSSTSWAWEDVHFARELCPMCSVGSYLTYKPLFVAELLFAPSVAQKLWDKDFSVQKGLPFLIFIPAAFNQVAEEHPTCICKSEVSTFRPESFLIFVDIFTPFGFFVLCSHALFVALCSPYCCRRDLLLS